MASDKDKWPAFSWHAWEPITEKMIPIAFPEWSWIDDMEAHELEARGAVPYLHRDAARAWQAFRDWCGPSRVCVWTQSEYDLWETDCDGAFQLNDGGPHDNDMTFCCYCGGALVEQAYEDAEVDDDD